MTSQHSYKIENKGSIKKIAIFYGFLTLLCILFLFTVLIFKNLNEYKNIVLLSLTPCLAILILLLYNLKIIRIENSGEVITIKKYHFYKNNSHKPIYEIPVNQIDSINIFKGLFASNVIMSIKSKNRVLKIKLKLLGFSKSQLNKINQAFY